MERNIYFCKIGTAGILIGINLQNCETSRKGFRKYVKRKDIFMAQKKPRGFAEVQCSVHRLSNWCVHAGFLQRNYDTKSYACKYSMTSCAECGRHWLHIFKVWLSCKKSYTTRNRLHIFQVMRKKM